MKKYLLIFSSLFIAVFLIILLGAISMNYSNSKSSDTRYPLGGNTNFYQRVAQKININAMNITKIGFYIYKADIDNSIGGNFSEDGYSGVNSQCCLAYEYICQNLTFSNVSFESVELGFTTYSDADDVQFTAKILNEGSKSVVVSANEGYTFNFTTWNNNGLYYPFTFTDASYHTGNFLVCIYVTSYNATDYLMPMASSSDTNRGNIYGKADGDTWGEIGYVYDMRFRNLNYTNYTADIDTTSGNLNYSIYNVSNNALLFTQSWGDASTLPTYSASQILQNITIPTGVNIDGNVYVGVDYSGTGSVYAWSGNSQASQNEAVYNSTSGTWTDKSQDLAYFIDGFSSDNIIPEVTINSPLNINYTTTNMTFNITALDDTEMDMCMFSLDGASNILMQNGGINVGVPAITSSYSLNNGYTAISLDNPANNNGTIKTINIFVDSTMSGVKVGTFYGSGGYYTMRDYQVISTSLSSGLNSIDVDIQIEKGDYIGIYYTGGYIKIKDISGDGYYLVNGDKFDGSGHTYSTFNSKSLSLNGSSYIEYIYENSSMTQGSHTTNYYCNDTSGNLNDTESVTFFIDSIAPSVNIIHPVDYNAYDTNTIDLNYSISDSGIGLDSCWYTNSSGVNVSTSCTSNTTIYHATDGSYNVTLYANDSLGNLGSDIVLYSISTTAPAITLDSPTLNEYINHRDNVYFNFTATDSNGLSSCQLWENTTGTWNNSYSWTNPVSGSMNWTTKNITNDGFYKYSIWCNDTNGDGTFASNNFTFTIDETFPIVSIGVISTTDGSQTIIFTNTINDTNLDSCKYSIYNSTGGIDGLNENITFTCNSPKSATVSAFGNYVLKIYAIDLAGNENSTNKSFTTTASVPGTSGGGGTVIIGTNESQWSMNTIGNLEIYDIIMLKGTSRDLSIEFENLGTEERTITLYCEDIEGEICQYVVFEEKTFTLPLIKEVKTRKSFSINLPNDMENGDYKFNIIGVDDNEASGLISVFLGVGTTGLIFGTLTRLGLSTKSGFPYILIFLPALIVSIFILTKVIPKKTPLKTLWVVVFGLVASIVAINVF